MDQVKSAAAAMRAETNRPFDVNRFIGSVPKTDEAVLDRARERPAPWYDALGLGEPPDLAPSFGDGHVALLLDLRPVVVSFHFGVPGPEAVRALKQAGIVLISTATRGAEARALVRADRDAVIAQGWEAGGHRGSHLPTLPEDGVGGMA